MPPPSPQRPSALRSLWLKWKSLALPWRKQRLMGHDLAGTTYWELHNANHGARPRRIARYPRATHHSDAFMSPAWIQWLRHTRADAPSVREQQLDLVRREQLKQLAAAADARWAEKPSFLDAPRDTAQVPPEVLQPRTDAGALSSVAREVQEPAADKVQEDAAGAAETSRPREKGEEKENPWAKHRGGPSEEWQPRAWIPGKVERG